MRCTALTRRCGCGSLYVRELSAGAAFVPAGFSPGTGDCARGGTDGGTDGGTVGERRGDAELLPSRAVGLAVLAGRLSSVHARHCVPVAALFLGSRSVFAFLSRRFSLARVWHCVPVAALFLGSRLLFVLRQTGRLAICSVPIPPGRDRHSCVLAVSVRLSAFVGSLRVWPFLYGDPDGGRRDAEDAGTGNGVGGES